jgi:iron complex outermembrane receptor protein
MLSGITENSLIWQGAATPPPQVENTAMNNSNQEISICKRLFSPIFESSLMYSNIFLNISRQLRIVLVLLFASTPLLHAQNRLNGIVRDANSRETLIGATVVLKGTKSATTTDIDGKFELIIPQETVSPYTLTISYVGYAQTDYSVKNQSVTSEILLKADNKVLKEVSVVESRLTEKQRESPLTVEAMDILAIRQTPAANFYDGLGALKGVDVTAASLGFKVVNTRGFNSTSPVRSLQLIDGVDNQAPGLNFSLGNFLGTSELDLLKVDLVAGASSAFYGPNAFNGVISMTTRSPFVKPGLEVSVKTGSRELLETALRYAKVWKNNEGEDKLGVKFNAFFLKAYDWVADNRDATPQSRSDVLNPGGYDAVNVYGDEYYSGGDFSLVPSLRPGFGIIYRSGYAEKDLVDYNTRNAKLNAAVHYKINPKTELIASSNFGTGTTVYQGDNRYSLKNILFYQNRLEIKQQDKFFLRAYMTNEDAGDSYDAFFTALLLQRAVKSDADWVDDYTKFFNQNNYFNKIRSFPGYPQASQYPDFVSYLASINPFLLENYYDSLVLYHGGARDYANSSGNPIKDNDPYLIPGTFSFDSTFQAITSRESFAQGGSKFFDRSALYHIQGEYTFDVDAFKFTAGGNFRRYTPNSRGTIFSDTSGIRIQNSEFGLYSGIERKLMEDRLKLNATVRIDKNTNFNYLVSPAISGIYMPDEKQSLRLSFSSAIRNPTLADQYLYYQVGRATLIGNLNGYDSLVTIPSLLSGLNYQNLDTLSYFNVDPVKPEQVRTLELGYRNTFFNSLFIDLNAYYSVYTNFIGYKVGADVTVIPGSPLPIYLNNIYRVATNSQDLVATQGVSVGASWYFKRFYTLTGNYSWNQLDRMGSDDPLIPAFNTPRNKFNIGISGTEIDNKIGQNWGFSINYKWVEGFLFEGSPQFTGEIESYGLLDAQVTRKFPETKSTFKLGCSNILNNLHYEVYGGPLIGRLVYFQVLVELN